VHVFAAYTKPFPCSSARMDHFVQHCSFVDDRPTRVSKRFAVLFSIDGTCTTLPRSTNIDWSDGRVVMALVSGSPEMSLLVRNRVGSNPTLIIILLFYCSDGSIMSNALVDG
jgi:hypothetical protein